MSASSSLRTLVSSCAGLESGAEKSRNVLAHLLHALNQPLTGLQCSLELAVAQARRPDQYVLTLNESLELTLRMRLLVETIRELTDNEPENPKECETLQLDALLGEAADDLRPVADERDVHLVLALEPPLPVRAERSHLRQIIFRFLESALSLARMGSEFRLTARHEPAHAVLDVSWSAAPLPALSPFSRAELGLLVARAAWENMGAQWTSSQSDNSQACTIRLALAASTQRASGATKQSAVSEI